MRQPRPHWPEGSIFVSALCLWLCLDLGLLSCLKQAQGIFDSGKFWLAEDVRLAAELKCVCR